MATRPKSDLGDLIVPKGGITPSEDTPAAAPAGSKGHTLSLRLTNEQYRHLRRFVAAQEERRGARVTHQAIIEEALSEYIARHGG